MEMVIVDDRRIRIQPNQSAERFLADANPIEMTIYDAAWIQVDNRQEPNLHVERNPQQEAELVADCEKLLQKLENDLEELPQGMKGINARKGFLKAKCREEMLQKATNAEYVSGKWLLRLAVDNVLDIWKLIVVETLDGNLGTSSKISTNDFKGVWQICVYTKDFNDWADVERVGKHLLDLTHDQSRFTSYKPDIFTITDIYSGQKLDCCEYRIGTKSKATDFENLRQSGKKLMRLPEKDQESVATSSSSPVIIVGDDCSVNLDSLESMLLDMGFNAELVKSALLKCGGDINQAMDYINNQNHKKRKWEAENDQEYVATSSNKLASSSSAVHVDDDVLEVAIVDTTPDQFMNNLEKMQDMGYDVESVKLALQECNGDIGRAIDYIDNLEA